jgi:hypothetical protein
VTSGYSKAVEYARLERIVGVAKFKVSGVVVASKVG